jgi:aminoglycoside 6-adenylyltransferase
MRTEKEMLDLILNTAKNDERIRAVIMNGSRVNPNVSRDIFQDFDIIYVVSDIFPYINNTAWIKRFGELMILQMPDLMGNSSSVKDGIFSYLMLFKDGNRIDLKIFPTARLKELYNDSLSVLLLDKDGIINQFPSPDEKPICLNLHQVKNSEIAVTNSGGFVPM